MTDHSPTPWKLEDETILDADGAIVYEDGFRHDSDAGRPLDNPDLKFIVQCVNRCHRLNIVLQKFITREAQKLNLGYEHPYDGLRPRSHSNG